MDDLFLRVLARALVFCSEISLRVKGNVFIDIFTKFKIFGLILITIVRISKLFTIIT